MVIDFKKFQETQESIYSDWRKNMSLLLATKRDKALENADGGFIVAVRPAENIVGLTTEHSRKIAELSPAMSYNGGNLHTTLFTYKAGPKVNVMDLSSADGPKIKDSIAVLAEIVYQATCAIYPIPFNIDYPEVLFNDTGVMAAGRPEQGFTTLAGIVFDLAGKNGIVIAGDKPEMKLPRMGHMSMNRFTTDKSMKELEKFQGYIAGINANGGLGVSRTRSIDVGRYSCAGDKFTLIVDESFTYKR